MHGTLIETPKLILVIGLLRPETVEITLNAGIKYFPPPKNYDRE